MASSFSLSRAPNLSTATILQGCCRKAFGMWLGWIGCARRAVRHNVIVSRRLLSTQAQRQHAQLAKTRNIGIIAHIDAVSWSIIEYAFADY